MNTGGKRGCRRKGFTLIEVVAAIVLLSVGLSGVCGLLLQTTKLAWSARAHYVAINIGKSRLERARAMDYESVPMLGEDAVEIGVDGQPNGDGDFRRTTIVSVAGTNLTEVVVTVDIRDRKTRDFEGEGETIRTLLTQYGEPD